MFYPSSLGLKLAFLSLYGVTISAGDFHPDLLSDRMSQIHTFSFRLRLHTAKRKSLRPGQPAGGYDWASWLDVCPSVHVSEQKLRPGSSGPGWGRPRNAPGMHVFRCFPTSSVVTDISMPQGTGRRFPRPLAYCGGGSAAEIETQVTDRFVAADTLAGHVAPMSL